MLDMYNVIDATKLAISIAGRTASVTGSGIDLKGYEGCLFVPMVGAWAGNQGTWVFSTQESDDNVSYSNVAAAGLLGTAPTMSGIINRAYTSWGYRGAKRYVRPVATLTGGGQTCNIGCLVVRGFKRHEPVT